MSTNAIQKPDLHAILVRLPRSLHDELRDKAARDRRSVNAQVIIAIEQHLKESA